MAAEALNRAFEPGFSTPQTSKTGLGLAICRQIMTHHGGMIAIDSTLGNGTTVTITLVRAETARGPESGE